MVARNPSCGCQSSTPFNPASGCCAECVCYPNLDHIVTDCSDVPCLYDNDLIAGELPFGGDMLLSRDSGCDYSSGSFDVTICDIDLGMFHWELTVGTGSLDGSTLTLVPDGSNSLPPHVWSSPRRLVSDAIQIVAQQSQEMSAANDRHAKPERVRRLK